MSTLKSRDLISLQSIIFLEESTDSFSAHKPISTASRRNEGVLLLLKGKH